MSLVCRRDHLVVDVLVVPQTPGICNPGVGVLGGVDPPRLVPGDDRVRGTDVVRVRVRTQIELDIRLVHPKLVEVAPQNVLIVQRRDDPGPPRVPGVAAVREVPVLTRVDEGKTPVALEDDRVRGGKSHDVDGLNSVLLGMCRRHRDHAHEHCRDQHQDPQRRLQAPPPTLPVEPSSRRHHRLKNHHSTSCTQVEPAPAPNSRMEDTPQVSRV